MKRFLQTDPEELRPAAVLDMKVFKEPAVGIVFVYEGINTAIPIWRRFFLIYPKLRKNLGVGDSHISFNIERNGIKSRHG